MTEKEKVAYVVNLILRWNLDENIARLQKVGDFCLATLVQRILILS